MITEINELKEKVGRLGLYLLTLAEEEIREMYNQSIFQKANIKKRFLTLTKENSLKIREHFKETYNQYLNNSLSSTLLKSKEKVLNFKNNLLNTLKKDFLSFVKKKIQANYSEYLNYLIKQMKDLDKTFMKDEEIILEFNDFDMNEISKLSDSINSIFGVKVNIKPAEESILGGFKLILPRSNIVIDNTISNKIEKSEEIIDMVFSKIISDEKVSEIENSFEKFIINKKNSIDSYLSEYDKL
ncbi:MAG: V-type ATP synthase subunit E family protein [Promethearchaeota archaeon]